MIKIARLPADDRRELFHNTAAKTGLHDAIVEKDFWVCLTLDYLFHRSPWKKAVTFKGGTSLSKSVYRCLHLAGDPAGDRGAGCLDTGRTGGYYTVCRGAVSAIIQAEGGICPDSGARTDFLGKGVCAARPATESGRFQNEVLSASLGTLPGGCSAHLKAASSVIPSGCAAGGLLCHAEYALWGNSIF